MPAKPAADYYSLDVFNEVAASLFPALRAFAGTRPELQCPACGKVDERAAIRAGCVLTLPATADRYDLCTTYEGFLFLTPSLAKKLAAVADLELFLVKSAGKKKFALVLPRCEIPVPATLHKYKPLAKTRPGDYVRAFADPCPACGRYPETTMEMAWFPVPPGAGMALLALESKDGLKSAYIVSAAAKAALEAAGAKKIKYHPVGTVPPGKKK